MKRITQQTALEMMQALERSVAVYHLLHAHAQGHTDLTETQLANVVTGVADEASALLSSVHGGPALPRDDGGRWIALAHRRATTRRIRRRLH